MSQIQPASSRQLSSCRPRVVTAGVPMRRPDVTKWRLRIVRDRILVDGNVRPAERSLCVLAGNALADQADQKQVVVRAAGDNVVTAVHEHLRHGLGIAYHLLLILHE